jgi:hypothetical protein
MRLLVVAVVTALLCTACSSATLVASRSLTDEELCVMGGGMWRVGHCQPCGGGM